ncbi:Hypothetical protein POVR2_LOCUS319 [uncultured virus]|nr:Hypothetical protein POVR2_LOCUS319 [uncultured virus]
MQSLAIVCHPVVMDRIEQANDIQVLCKSNCGPLGLLAYRLLVAKIDLHSVIKSYDLAEPYRVVLSSATLANYSLDHLYRMLSMFLQKTIRAKPTGYDVIRFSEPAMVHIYPMYGDDYLYAGKNERKLLYFDPIACLGFIPLFLSERCWNHMRVLKPVAWGRSAILHSEDLIYSEDDIESTLRETNYDRRVLLRAAQAREENEHVAQVVETETEQAASISLAAEPVNVQPVEQQQKYSPLRYQAATMRDLFA